MSAATEVTGTVHERFALAFAAVGAIGKDQQNSHHKYRYRGIDDVMNVLHGVLAAHGLFYLPRCVAESYEEWTTKNGSRQQVARLHYEFVFCAPDGSQLVVGPVVGQSADTDDKAPMQALSQAAKYALLQAFCIPTEDVTDPDSRAPMSADGGRAAPEPQRITQEHQALLDELEAVLVSVAEAGVEIDPDLARRHAVNSPDHAVAAINAARQKLPLEDVPF